jgi:hypothetical protein
MMHNPRTCNAFHSAAENLSEEAGSYTLREVDQTAQGYIREGMSTCTCGHQDQYARLIREHIDTHMTADLRFACCDDGFRPDTGSWSYCEDNDCAAHRVPCQAHACYSVTEAMGI